MVISVEMGCWRELRRGRVFDAEVGMRATPSSEERNVMLKVVVGAACCITGRSSSSVRANRGFVRR